MLHDPELQARLAAIFRSEYQQYSSQLQTLLKALASGQGLDSCCHEAFRIAHNLKGAAGAIGLMPIANLAHDLETLLQRSPTFDEEVIEICYAFLSQIEAWLELPAGRINWEEPRESEVRLWIQDWLGRGGGATAAPPVQPEMESAGGVPRAAEAELVRIPLARLESILAEITELTLAQSRMAHRQLEVDSAFRQLQAIQKDWERLYSLQRKAAREGGKNSQKLLEVLELQRGRFRHFHSWFRLHRGRLLSDSQTFGSSVDSLSLEANNLRLVALDELFDWLERQARDLARRLEKKVVFRAVGQETRLDRHLVEGLRDPLMHLVRNCLDHGLEGPAQRQAAGKETEGRLCLSAQARGQNIIIEVSDDGAGVDWDKVQQQAQALGWVNEGEGGPGRLSDFLFRPGFSTRQSVTEVSGRGYGLDIVAAGVEALHGHVELESQAGQGTRFRLTVPLTQATLHGLLVGCGDHIFAVAISVVERVLPLDKGGAKVERVGSALMLQVDSHLIPLLLLDEVLGLPLENRRDRQFAVILSAGHSTIAIQVDRVLGDEHLVIKSLGPLLGQVGHFSAGAVLEDGEVVLLLNPLELLRGGKRARRESRGRALHAAEVLTKHRILVVDDSITSRTLEKSILENAGYDVVTGSDGEEGVHLARTSGCQLVISDIEMPRLNGFQLARRIKSDPAIQHIPVVLVTSLTSAQDKARGLEAGADAYVVKGEFDQSRFLELVAGLLERGGAEA